MAAPKPPPRSVKAGLAPREELEIDFLVLADAVQVQSDKLFMLGGGWSFIRVNKFPATHLMGVGVGIMVPWLETNTRHRFILQIRNEDTKATPVKIEGEFEQGRPPGTPRGMKQRVVMAFNFALQIEAPAPFVLELVVNGLITKRQPFEAVQAGVPL